MDYLMAFLTQLTRDAEMAQIAFIVLMGAAVFATGLAGMYLVSSAMDPVRRRLERLNGQGGRPKGRLQGLVDATRPVRAYIMPKGEGERTAMRLRLIHAGYRNDNALPAYYAIKTLLAVALPAVVLAVVHFLPAMDQLKVATMIGIAAAIGVFGPNIFVEHKVEARQRRLRNGLPDALDLLVVCTEAGYGLKAAIQRVGEELSVSHPELAWELGLVNVEIQAGMESVEALRNLAERTGLKDIRGLVALLSQSVRFGTSVAEALRVYAEEFRDKRMQRAEEQAATISTRMIFPLVTCLFPAFFVVTVGPALLGVMAMFNSR